MSVTFILNHINKSSDHAKIYIVHMTLLVYKRLEEWSQFLHLLDSCLLHYVLSSDSKAITLQKGVTTPYISF